MAALLTWSAAHRAQLLAAQSLPSASASSGGGLSPSSPSASSDAFHRPIASLALGVFCDVTVRVLAMEAAPLGRGGNVAVWDGTTLEEEERWKLWPTPRPGGGRIGGGDWWPHAGSVLLVWLPDVDESWVGRWTRLKNVVVNADQYSGRLCVKFHRRSGIRVPDPHILARTQRLAGLAGEDVGEAKNGEDSAGAGVERGSAEAAVRGRGPATASPSSGAVLSGATGPSPTVALTAACTGQCHHCGERGKAEDGGEVSLGGAERALTSHVPSPLPRCQCPCRLCSPSLPSRLSWFTRRSRAPHCRPPALPLRLC